jgi:predicted nucleic acid-binding protein
MRSDCPKSGHLPGIHIEPKKIYPGPDIIERMFSLLEAVPVKGPSIHDLHLAATMLENGITKIYTFNVQDFEPIPGIEVLNPPEVA